MHLDKESRRFKIMRNTLFGILNRIFNVILSFVLRTVFIRNLGIQYTGVSSLFTDILTVLSFVELGIGTAVSAALYTPLKENNESTIRKLMKFYRIAYRYIAIIVIVAGCSVTPFLGHLVKDVPDIKESIQVIFLLYVVRTAVSYLLIYKVTIIDADQKQYQIKNIETIFAIIRYTINIFLIFIFKEFILYLISEIILVFIQNIIISKKAEKQYPYAFVKSDERLSHNEIKKLAKDIKGLAMYKVSGTVGNSIDNILISSFIGTAMVGVVSNYTLIKGHVEQIVSQFFYSLTPSIGNLVAENDTDKQFIVFNRVYYFTFALVNFCACTYFVLINPFIKLWIGFEYTLNVMIGFIIALDFFLYMLLQAIASFRTANGIFIKGQLRPLIMAIMNIVLSIVFIQKWGVFGTIFATSLCRILTQWYDPFILFKYVFKKSYMSYYVKYWFYIFIFISGTAITYWITNTLVDVNNWGGIVIRLFICLIVPNVWVIILTFWSDEFKYYKSFFLEKICSK